MTTAVAPVSPSIAHPITADEFLAMPDSKGHELEEGRLVELNMGAESSWVAGAVYRILANHVLEKKLGWAFPPETAFQCFGEHTDSVRKPDAAFIRFGRLPNERLPEGFITIAPDLVVEVVSPNDTAYEVERKVKEYLAAGVRLVWVIYPETKTARVHRPSKRTTELDSGDELDGEDVLATLRIRLAELFPPAMPA